MSNRNPNNSSVLQALLDASDLGYGSMTVDQLITRVSSDRKLCAALQAKWNGHAYPERAMDWAQLARSQALMTLSDPALKVLTLLGMYCHQSGLIQVRIEDICTATSIGRTSVKQAITELRACGALNVAAPSVRHAAPVYCVNPGLVNKGVRRKADTASFIADLSIEPEKYILNRELTLVVQTDVVHNATMTYNRLYLVPPGEAACDPPKRRRRKKPENSQVPGQMSLSDFPAVWPEE